MGNKGRTYEEGDLEMLGYLMTNNYACSHAYGHESSETPVLVVNKVKRGNTVIRSTRPLENFGGKR